MPARAIVGALELALLLLRANRREKTPGGWKSIPAMPFSPGRRRGPGANRSVGSGRPPRIPPPRRRASAAARRVAKIEITRSCRRMLLRIDCRRHRRHQPSVPSKQRRERASALPAHSGKPAKMKLVRLQNHWPTRTSTRAAPRAHVLGGGGFRRGKPSFRTC